MVIPLWHDIHGSKIAICQAEADYDMKHGWRTVETLSPSPPAWMSSTTGPKTEKITKVKNKNIGREI